MLKPLAITSGEPAGIGPDLCIKIAAQNKLLQQPLVILGDRQVFANRAKMLGLSFDVPEWDVTKKPLISFLHVPCAGDVRPGELNANNASHVLRMLDVAIKGCLDKDFAGVVTAPVHKGVINDAGIPFTGHTEYLAEHTDTEQVVMMLAGGGLKVALATTHLPLADVSDALTPELLERVLTILNHDLKKWFGIVEPRILVAGLNPHAGESGHMGREEIDVIEPVLDRLRMHGLQLIGPLPADTLFQPKYLESADAVLSMFHDQGLPVLKFASFGKGVNITLGLPIVRTSVDHGTALDLAGKGIADEGSLLEAIRYASEMANANRQMR
ncbi:4-hydroxythreonine-4-phosphate dehydrogenase PdxA [Leeia sp. TBRC 13508]|uniref:4-hydroxythreonine-4-phosphate dehydrogenase n=1 Tax=Leeia speluncae TaxID=2884804 RepID=A0ABS8D5G9_9NEIS|nr:4-hydroxythreonine-4-phosphate dehydrogenase PdxA [Leeia speluncae]MCB6183439.1 4-hydroxythreonine-4-phosphate dehydrogenase PdxA [Leeia speluncae]